MGQKTLDIIAENIWVKSWCRAIVTEVAKRSLDIKVLSVPDHFGDWEITIKKK